MDYEFDTPAETRAFLKGLEAAAALLERKAARRGPGPDTSALLAAARAIRKSRSGAVVVKVPA